MRWNCQFQFVYSLTLKDNCWLFSLSVLPYLDFSKTIFRGSCMIRFAHSDSFYSIYSTKKHNTKNRQKGTNYSSILLSFWMDPYMALVSNLADESTNEAVPEKWEYIAKDHILWISVELRVIGTPWLWYT